MGLRLESLGLLLLAIGNEKQLQDLTMCELGDQMFKLNKKESPAKKLFESLGVKHTSIDWNGKHGAEMLNLNAPVLLNGEALFDVVTNFGTSEHVARQYECFANIHNLCKVGGIMVHQVPMIGREGSFHGLVNYAEVFFDHLAKMNHYQRVMQNRISNFPMVYYKKQGQVFSVLRKKGKDPFVTEEQFRKLTMHMKERPK